MILGEEFHANALGILIAEAGNIRQAFVQQFNGTRRGGVPSVYSKRLRAFDDMVNAHHVRLFKRCGMNAQCAWDVRKGDHSCKVRILRT